MSAPQNQKNGMWVYNFDENDDENAQTLPLMNIIYKITKTTELVNFLHAAAGFPVTDTWVKAICNTQFVIWPGLTSALVYKKLPKSNETIKGHLKQQQQNV